MTTCDPNLTNDNLGAVLVTGGSGFVGGNFVQTLLDQGYKVTSFDIAPSDLKHKNLTLIEGNICDSKTVEKAVKGIDTVFHTAAIIGLKGGKSVSKEYRDLSYSINVEGTKGLLKALQKAGGSRFIYTASNSVIIGGKPVKNGDETSPYTTRFNDIYTETKVVAEKWVLEQNDKEGVLTCSIRPSGIWGPGDQTMFKMFFEHQIAGIFLARIGNGKALLDNTYVHNLIHGEILAAQHLVKGGTAAGEAFFINDGEPINMFEFAAPVIESCGQKMPTMSVPYWLVRGLLITWHELHFRFGFPEPPLPPLAIERIAVDNYFSIEKAKKLLGYKPLYNTAEGVEESKPFYRELFNRMAKDAGKEKLIAS